MIELLRYARVKPDNLVHAELDPDGSGVIIYFKRFDVENGREVEPETSRVSFKDLETRLTETDTERKVLVELLGLR
jgi:hypothetical protein